MKLNVDALQRFSLQKDKKMISFWGNINRSIILPFIYRLKSFGRSVHLKNFLPFDTFQNERCKKYPEGVDYVQYFYGVYINSRIYIGGGSKICPQVYINYPWNLASRTDRRISTLSSCSQKGSYLFPGLISAISQILLTQFWPNFWDPIFGGLNFCGPKFFLSHYPPTHHYPPD